MSGIPGLTSWGFNVRRDNGKLLIKPSKAAIRRIREGSERRLRLTWIQRAGGHLRAEPRPRRGGQPAVSTGGSN